METTIWTAPVGGWEAGGLLGVVPILPTVNALVALLPVLMLSIFTALLSLRHPRVALGAARFLWTQKFPLVVLLAVGVAMVFAVGRFAVRPVPADDNTAVTESWPLHRANLRRTGCQPHELGPTAGGLNWSAGGLGETFHSSPAVVGDRAYVVGSKGDRGRIHCYDIASGTRLWSAAPSGYRATFSSPVIAHGRLLCGEGLHHAKTARVVCIDLRPGNERQILWTFQTNSHVECSPVVYEQRVYFGAGDDGVYCLDLDAGADGKPRVIWHQPGERLPDAETSLVVSEGRVYAGLGIGGEALCVLDAATGEELKRIAMPYPVFSPPSIDRGKLLVGMGVGDYVTPNESPAGQVSCIDLQSLAIEWSFPTAGTILGSVVVHDDLLVFGCSDGYLYVLDRAGKLQRRWNSWSPIVTSPVVCGDAVYAVNQGGIVFGLELSSLKPFWEYRFERAGRYVSSPVVAQGHLLLGTDDRGFVSLGSRLAGNSQDNWPGHLGGSGFAGCRDRSRIPDQPVVAWNVLAGNRIVAPVAAVGSDVVVPVAEGPFRGLVLFDSEAPSSRRLWAHPVEVGVWSSPVVVGSHLLALAGRPDQAEVQLLSLDLKSGQVEWEMPVDPTADTVLTADRRGALLPTVAGKLRAIGLDGKDAWTVEAGLVTRPVFSNDSLVVAIVESPAALVVLDRLTGRELWSHPLLGQPLSAPFVADDTIYVFTSQGLESRSLLDGNLMKLPEGKHDRPASPVHWSPPGFVFIGELGELVVRRGAPPYPQFRFAGADTNGNPVVAGSSGLFRSGSRLVRWGLDINEPEAETWFALPPDEHWSSPLILHAGRLYGATSRRGLLCIAGGEGA